jgi:hypothetical protein
VRSWCSATCCARQRGCSGQTARRRCVTSLCMPSISRSPTNGWRAGDERTCTSILACAWRRHMAPGRPRSPRSWPSTFERGHDVRRAVQYWQQAAANAARRSGHHEVIRTLTRARAPPHAVARHAGARPHQELALLTALGPPLMATRGVAAPEVEQTYVRIQALAHPGGGEPARPLALLFYARGDRDRPASSGHS